MKPGLNYWRTICFISMVIFSLCLLNIVMAQDQNQPSGMDRGVWVLKEKKPDFEPAKDEPTYFNNHVSVLGNTVKGGWSWKDDPVKPECSGEVWGTCNWEEIPSVIQPGVGQNTTLTAEVGGSQSCAYRHVSARTELALNDQNLNEIYASTGYATSDPKPAPVSVKVPWEAPWGKIGDTFTVTVIAQVPGSVSNHFYYNYIYTYEAPGSQPEQYNSPLQPKQTDLKTPSSVSGNYAEKCGPCGGSDSGVRFSDLSGQVDLRPDCKEYWWKTAEIPTIPCMDDHVRTGEDSSAILSFADMTTFIMKPETEIILDVAPQRDAKVKLVSGDIWEKVKKMIREGKMEVEMSQGVMGIKGTTVVCEDTGSSSTLKVLEGTASFRSKATGEEILVNAGKMATATENGLSQPESFDVEAENARWEKITSKVEDDQEGVEGSGLVSKEHNPQDARGWYAKGYDLANLGRYDEAIEAYGEAIRLDSEYADAWYAKGYALDDLARYDEAIKAYDEAIRLDPLDTSTWYAKGYDLANLGRYDEAVGAYDEAIKLDPQYAKAWYAKGYALDELGRYNEAIEAYDEAIKFDSKYANAWYAKGYALYQLGRTTEADAAFAKARELGYTS